MHVIRRFMKNKKYCYFEFGANFNQVKLVYSYIRYYSFFFKLPPNPVFSIQHPHSDQDIFFSSTTCTFPQPPTISLEI